nr:hypothetical protein [Bradyrhizobium diazoefficiens]
MTVSKQFLATQAATLLAFAKATSDPKLSAKLIAKAADLRMRAEVLQGAY